MARKNDPVQRKPDRMSEFIKLSAVVMSKVGTVGFIVICVVAYIFFCVPQELKNELTNTWLLFKCKECDNFYITLFVILAALLGIQTFFFTRALKEKDQRLKEISKEKSLLQEKLLDKSLKSSNSRKP